MRIKKKRAAQTTLGKPRARSHERGRNLSKKENRKKITLEPTFPRGSRERCFLLPLSVVAVIFFLFFFLNSAFAPPWCTLLKNYLFFTFFFTGLLSLSRMETHSYITLSRKKTKNFTFKRARRGVSAYAIPFERGPLTIFAFE